MEWYILTKEVEGLNHFKIGDRIPLHRDRRGRLNYHVWFAMVTVPSDCVMAV